MVAPMAPAAFINPAVIQRSAYLAESFFLNTVKYENDKLEAYMKKLTKKA